MLFLAVLETLLLALLLMLVPSLLRIFMPGGPRTAFTTEHIPLWIGMASGGLALLYLLDMLPERAVKADAINLSPWFLLACGLSCSLGFGARLTKIGRSLHFQQTTGLQLNLPFGVLVLALLASVYLTFTALDHWWFLHGTDAGVTAPQNLGAVDVNCPLAVFRVTEQDAQYRCPTSVMFNQRFSKPFLPWPLYTTGRSPLLKEKYDEMIAR